MNCSKKNVVLTFIKTPMQLQEIREKCFENAIIVFCKIFAIREKKVFLYLPEFDWCFRAALIAFIHFHLFFTIYYLLSVLHYGALEACLRHGCVSFCLIRHVWLTVRASQEINNME